MIAQDKRIRIIVGHYGSGKSEFSANYVVKLRQQVEKKVAIADLDVVNVYFRTREKEDFFNKLDIQSINSSVSASTLDLPAVSAQFLSPISDESYEYVVDVGGDSVGARVLGRFKDNLIDNEYDMFCVINANRERTQTVEDVLGYISEIERASSLKVTGLINNTHLVRETKIEDIIKGDELIKSVSKEIGIPVKYTVCLRSLEKDLPNYLSGEPFIIDLYMREEWM